MALAILGSMNPLELLLLCGAIALPFYLLVVAECEKASDPGRLRDEGIVILSLRAIEDHSEVIGTYMGQAIWESITFKGMRYHFSRVAPPSYRERLRPRELFLYPGLVYITD